MIKELVVKNFKSIQDQNIKLRNINILIGQNGAGKSNFISIFKFLEKLVDRDLKNYIFKSGGIEDLIFLGYEHTDFFSLKIRVSDFDNISNIYEIKIRGNSDQYYIEEEKVGFWDESRYQSPYMDDLVKGSIEYESSLYENLKLKTTAPYVYDYLKSFKIYHFHDTSLNSRMRLLQDLYDNEYLKQEGQNIAAFLLFLRQKYFKNYQNIVENIQLVYPTFKDFHLSESKNAKGKILLRWQERYSNNIYNAEQISDGTLRFICIATLLLQPIFNIWNSETIILDEPELGLHPFAIHILSELIKKASINKQIIIATQSKEILNEFEPEDILITERKRTGETIFTRKTTEELKVWLEDYTIGELWDSNILGGRP